MKAESSAIIVRLPAELHRRLKRMSAEAGLSLNQTCVRLLQGDSPSSGIAPFARIEAAELGLNSLVQEVLAQYPSAIDGIVLFGSAARGVLTARSDIDLLIVLAEGEVLDRDRYAEWRWNTFAGREVSPLLVQLPDARAEVRGVWLEIALDGIVLFDRTLAVSRYLAQVRGLIAAGAFKRESAHGHPYWVRREITGRNDAKH